MKITEESYNIILKEFKEIENLCKDALSPEDKLYFFSASFGVVNRVMNFESDSILIFIHQILHTAHQTISQRLNSPKRDGVVSTSLPDEMWDALYDYFSELVSAFEKKNVNTIYMVLEKFAKLSYATTGNGFYLYLSGKIIL